MKNEESRMKNEESRMKKFEIKAYGKSELALLYFPDSTKDTALRRLNYWLSVNPRLRGLNNKKNKSFTPKQVQLIVDEVGEPF